jgi:hypothetical protein
LIVYVEPHEAGNVLETRVSRVDVGELEDRAEVLKGILLEKGWREIGGEPAIE